MYRRLMKFASTLLLGSLCAAASAAQPVPGTVPSDSTLEQLTLRQAEIFFSERNRELQFAKRAVEDAEADMAHRRLSQSVRPMDFDKQEFIDKFTWLIS